nr:HrpB1 family type III secretion system apparatus protein [uncultured Thiocystis sp.]
MDEDSIKLLAELALIAGGRGLIDHAEKMVAALVVLRPESERPYLIHALVRLGQRDADGAEYILRERALKANPNSTLALAYLGLALHQQGRANERNQILYAAINGQDGDEDALRLSQNLLATPIA